jgi:UDP-glucose 4-epimerase
MIGVVVVTHGQLATELVRWHPELSITALRFSNVMVAEDYAQFPSFDADAQLRKWNLWGYIDARDGAQAIERALDVAPPGFDRFIIAAADTVMSRPNADLVAEVFPDVPISAEFGEHDTLLSIDKARRLLGFAPQHSWRDHVDQL